MKTYNIEGISQLLVISPQKMPSILQWVILLKNYPQLAVSRDQHRGETALMIKLAKQIIGQLLHAWKVKLCFFFFFLLQLSPALRNRFTEIWCPPSDARADLVQIIEHNIKPGVVLKSACQGKKVILDAFICVTFGGMVS